MACKSKYYPIAMKITGYLPLYEDTSGIDFEAHRSILLAGHGPKVGHNELQIALLCVSSTESFRVLPESFLT